MALPPGIPTSFVPRQPVQPHMRQPSSSGTNLFLIASMIIGAAAVAASLGVFAYDKLLTRQLEQKAEELAAAQARVNEDTIEDFVRLRDRLASGTNLLTNQIALSQFFDTLERLTLQNVRFNTMSLAVAGDSTAKLDVEGTARNFNTLAAQSNALASERGIKRAIFSGITLTDTRQVEFRLTADLDPRLISAGKDGIPAGPVDALTVPTPATSTPATSTPVRAASTTP